MYALFYKQNGRVVAVLIIVSLQSMGAFTWQEDGVNVTETSQSMEVT